MGFFREGLKNLKTIGSIARSSPYLCAKMVGLADLSSAKCVVELGAGDGVMTAHILKGMSSDAKLIAFEINKKFCEKLNRIGDPRLVVIEDSAEHLALHLDGAGYNQIDVVFSALPFVVLPKTLAQSIVQTCHRCLKPKGEFFQFHYSLIGKSLYKKIFGNLDIRFQLFNIPPAFIMSCRKAG